MNVTVYQCISVYNLKIGTISNSSVLQIGTSGRIHTLSNSYNASEAASSPSSLSEDVMDSPLVPLPAAAELNTCLN